MVIDCWMQVASCRESFCNMQLATSVPALSTEDNIVLFWPVHAVKHYITNQFCIHHVTLPALTGTTPILKVSRVPPALYACSPFSTVSFLWFLAHWYQHFCDCAAVVADAGDTINTLALLSPNPLLRVSSIP